MIGALEDFFEGDRTALRIHARLLSELTAVGGVEVRVSRAQVAHRSVPRPRSTTRSGAGSVRARDQAQERRG
ncbi:hypothetical protein ACFFOS_01740 [Nocardioides kongjuensis]|uniref:Uncharacterized protein n=1 Tax=Nocardioides kongjuensis TaxID=349522 RepID=A0A852R9G7_9ACTN|nr:hypothetical protein [Nocardioides kongjuensis]NYD29667.1 hypothetical protein [Nocardioides kongjuensis]